VANPAFTASYSGWVNGDTLISASSGSPNLTTSATNGSFPGAYPIVATTGTLSASNYGFNFINGLLTITPATYPTNLTLNAGTSNLTLIWPKSHLGWTLQTQTNSLVTGLGTNWQDFASSAATNQIVVPIVPANGSTFFRLRR